MPPKKILIVDDEPDFSRVISMWLQNEGYDVDLAANGEEGLEKARSLSPDLIILDVGMPGKDGYTMLREMRSETVLKNTPVIITTGRSGMTELFAAEGVKDYLIKPFENEDLLQRIKKLTSDPT